LTYLKINNLSTKELPRTKFYSILDSIPINEKISFTIKRKNTIKKNIISTIYLR